LKKVAWEIPSFRQISSTWVPVSACLSAKAFFASGNVDIFTVFRISGSVFPPEYYPKNATLQRLHFVEGGQLLYASSFCSLCELYSNFYQFIIYRYMGKLF
jgi:hypothetical protein